MSEISLQTAIDKAKDFFINGKTSDSKYYCSIALELDPNNPYILQLQAINLIKTGESKIALEMVSRANQIKPNDADIKNTLASAYHANNRSPEAIKILEDILNNFSKTTNQTIIGVYVNHSKILLDTGNYEDSIKSANNALNIEESNIPALNNKASSYRYLGYTKKAFDIYNQALKFEPKNINTIRNILSLINYLPFISPLEIKNFTKNFLKLHKPIEKMPTRTISFSNDRKIKVGYISPDFRKHPVGLFFKNICKYTNKEKFDLKLYYNNPIRDDVTIEINNLCKNFQVISELSDLDVARKIRTDEIDILIDLAGHTDGNRLGAMRYKPAPIQATWLGYYATTGLEDINFVISDKYVLPEKDKNLFTEHPIHLKYSYLCFEPPQDNILPRNRNLEEKNKIVFGCFNNTQKINEELLDIWKIILNSTNNSFLFLKSFELSNREIRKHILKILNQKGINKERVILEGETSRSEHLSSYNQVDIALDTFPYNGGMTTAEALWMGVPVVTLNGDRWVSRVGTSIMNTAGLTSLIANNTQEYIEIASDLANDRNKLGMLHRSLRTILVSSPFCNHKQYVKNFEDSLISKIQTLN